MTVSNCRAGGSGLAGVVWAAIVLALALFAAEVGVIQAADAPTAPRFAPLPGKAVGVLVGQAHELFVEEGRFGPPDAIGFGRGRGSYRWVYVPARGGIEGEAITLGVGEAGDASQEFKGMVLATARTIKPWGITSLDCLVEVEVNGGRGSGPTESFAATDLKVLDGTPAYPLKVAEALRTLRDLYRGELTRRATAIRSAMDKARNDALKDRDPTGPRKQSDHVFVTWLPDSERLYVEFRTRVRDGAFRVGKGTERIGGDNPRSGAAPRDEVTPRDQGIPYGTSFGVFTGMAYEVSKGGTIVVSQPLPLRQFVEEIPPPGAAPPNRPR